MVGRQGFEPWTDGLKEQCFLANGLIWSLLALCLTNDAAPSSGDSANLANRMMHRDPSDDPSDGRSYARPLRARGVR